ncbi:sensor histidine kinase [Thermophilibacter sp.]
MLLRNPEVKRSVVAFLAVGAAGSVAAWRLAGPAGCACVAATAAALLVVLLVATRRRYRALARLAEQVDAVLHGERDVSFERMREGELAILSSELDKMRSRLTLANEELAHERNALADALADVSHQIKTPLTSLTLMTSLTRAALVAEGGHEAEVARLRTSERLEAQVEWLVASLLKLARIDAGVVRFARERVDAVELVARAAEPLEVAFELAGVELARDVAAGSGFTGDAAWSAEALENVLKNCLEHTPAGGRVSVTAREDALAFRLRVEDTGTGIDPEDLPHVFDRFYRGGEKSASSEVEPGGVGIGLALAKSLVTAQGGSVRASNVTGADGRVTGAAFDLVFFKATV